MWKLSKTRFRCNETITRSEYAEDEDIKLYLCVTPCEGFDWIHLLQLPVRGFCENEGEQLGSYINETKIFTTHATVNSPVITSISGTGSTEPESEIGVL
jgi:hypothetical protein